MKLDWNFTYGFETVFDEKLKHFNNIQKQEFGRLLAEKMFDLIAPAYNEQADKQFQVLFEPIERIKTYGRVNKGLKHIGLKIIGQVIIMNKKEIMERSKFQTSRGMDKWIGEGSLRYLEDALKEDFDLEIGMWLPKHIIEKIKTY